MSSFGGKSVNTNYNSIVHIDDYNIAETQELHDWFEKSDPSVQRTSVTIIPELYHTTKAKQEFTFSTVAKIVDIDKVNYVFLKYFV